MQLPDDPSSNLGRGIMAHDDIEIEFKFSLDKSSSNRIRKMLLAKKVSESFHKDDYYTPPHRNFMKPRQNEASGDASSCFAFEYFSIRRRGGDASVNYKHFYPENVEKTTHCDEFETHVKDPEKMEKILSSLNFSRLITIEKRRETFMHGDFEVSLDEVKDLGSFIEIESARDLGGIEKTRKALLNFAQSLGIDMSSMKHRGYVEMMLRKKGLMK